MPDKLTDKEIKKDLEHHTNFSERMGSTYSTISVTKLKYALDLINRLQAEKQSLKYDYDNLQRQFDEIYQQFHYLSNVEIPYLYSFTEDKDKKLETIANILLRTKAEAYKEFWNCRPPRLEEKSVDNEEYNKGWNACLDEFWEIRNNLLKELVGEDK